MLSIENIRKAFEFFPKPCMILLGDAPQFTITYVNRAFVKTVNSFVNEMIGKGLFDAFPATDMEKQDISSMLKNRTSNEQIYPILDSDNTPRFFFFCPPDIKSFLAGTRFVKDHDLPASTRVANELKLKETIGHFEEQNLRLREISWMQSHVVRAPLARILGLAELLIVDEGDQSRAELITHLKDSATELDRIIYEIVKKTEGL